MEWAVVFDVTSGALAHDRGLRCLEKFPFATLVMSDECFNILLHFLGGDWLLNLLDLILSCGLLVILFNSGAHARVTNLSGFLSNKIAFVPFLFPIFFITHSLMLSYLLCHSLESLRGIPVCDEGSIQWSDTLKIDGLSLDDILETEREWSTIGIRDVDATEGCVEAFVL